MKKARGGNNYCPRSLFFAHQIFAGFIVVFGIRLLWPLLMALGLVPSLGKSFPSLVTVARRKSLILQRLGC